MEVIIIGIVIIDTLTALFQLVRISNFHLLSLLRRLIIHLHLLLWEVLLIKILVVLIVILSYLLGHKFSKLLFSHNTITFSFFFLNISCVLILNLVSSCYINLLVICIARHFSHSCPCHVIVIIPTPWQVSFISVSLCVCVDIVRLRRS